MKQEQLLDDTRESEVVDGKILSLLVICSIVFVYLDRIARLTVHSRAPLEDNIYSMFLSSLGFAAGTLIYYFFRNQNRIVFTGILMTVTFCVWEIIVLAMGNYFDNWLQIYLLDLGKGMVSCSLVFTLLEKSKPFGKKQTYYILIVYFTPIIFLLIDVQQHQYILPENTGLFPIVICLLVLILVFFIFVNRGSQTLQEKLPAEAKKSPNRSIISLWVLLTVLLFICYRALMSNIPPGIEITDFFNNTDLMNLGGTLCGALFVFGIFIRTGTLQYKEQLKFGTIVFCFSVFIYCILFFYNQYLDINYRVFQILIQFVFMGGYMISVSLLSYVISFSENKYFVFYWATHLIPHLVILSVMLSIGPTNFLELLQGNIFYIIMLLTAISSILFLLYLNRTNTLIPDDDRTDRLQP